MYQIVTLEDEIVVPPTKFTMDLKEAVSESIEEKFEGKIDPAIGVVLAVKKIDEVGEGRVLPGDPSVHYPVQFKILTWMPKENEVIEGEIIDVAEFGAFVRCGALDGLVHISQVMDDYVSYNEKNSQLAGKQTKRILKLRDKVRVRIISISFKEQSKVGLTMRQPFLGSLRWLDEEKKLQKKKAKQKKKEEK